MYKDIHIPVKKVIPVYVVLWVINGLSHEFPLQIGVIYHHLCKDNSITNLIMAVILFYCFKGLTFSSKVIKKATSYIFAVFALNDTLVNATMKLLSDNGLAASINAGGFLVLAGVVFGILTVCLFVGVVSEGLL